MKSNLLLTSSCLFLLFGTNVTSFAASVDLQWLPNSETDIAGYRVYYKADSAVPPLDGVGALEGAAPIDVQNQTKATIDRLDPGRTYYFAVTAYNTSGLESAYSDIIPKVPPLPDTTGLPYTIFDALLALRITVGIDNPTPEQTTRTDISPVDGKTDIRDVLGILRDVVGLQKI